MFAIAFDLDVAAAHRHHPGKHQGAYKDIRNVLNDHGFRPIQGSTYAADHEDQVRLFLALTTLRRFDGFGGCLKNLRVFRMETGADFTGVMKSIR